MSQKKTSIPSVQCFGKKKNAVAVSHCKAGKGLIKINGTPIQNLQPKILRYKLYEPILAIGNDHFANLDIRVRVKGGGTVAQIYAIRQAISRSVVAYAQKCNFSKLSLLVSDEVTRMDFKNTLLKSDRSLLVSDSRRMEPKKFGGPGARARYQKSYR